MNPSETSRRLIVNADDFGRSASVNEAVVRAHREGILTTASLMVNEPACDEAVALARENPRLGVGLHLTLLCGRAGLPAHRIPGLARDGLFSDNPAAAGFRYFARPGLRDQIRAEIHEQFRRFAATGLTLDHVDGHLHIHLHPVVFAILMKDARELGIQSMRWTRDSLRTSLRTARGRWAYRLLHAFIFRVLSARSRGSLKSRGLRHTSRVFGLLQDSHTDEDYVLRLLAELPPGDSELYSHPSMDKFRHEFEALVSPQVKDLVARRGIQLIRYQDL
jgi:hopanoid biosynthesis associated protein HpnK